MPLLKIDVFRTRTDAENRALLDAVHAASVDAFEVPDTDRYQVLTQHGEGELVALDTGLGLSRTERLVIVHVISRQRGEAAKQKFYELLAGNLESRCQISPEDLIVTVTENGAADWSFGEGRAQFLTGEL